MTLPLLSAPPNGLTDLLSYCMFPTWDESPSPSTRSAGGEVNPPRR
jgi:hypothetical protein